jgi:MFS family permease
MAVTVAALGLLNTSISTIVTRISTSDTVGGLMGVLDTSEKLAGVVGPSIGGVLYAYHFFAPVYALVFAYALLAVLVILCFPIYILPSLDQAEKAAKIAASKKDEADKVWEKHAQNFLKPFDDIGKIAHKAWGDHVTQVSTFLDQLSPEKKRN